MVVALAAGRTMIAVSSLVAAALLACSAYFVFNTCVPAKVAAMLLENSSTFSLPVFLLGRRVRLVIVILV